MTDQNDQVSRFLLLDEDEDCYIIFKSFFNEAFGNKVKLDWYQQEGPAPELVCSGIYTVSLIDYSIGFQKGLELLRRVKEQCPDQVVFLVSDWDHCITEEEARKEGADGYLPTITLSVELIKLAFNPYLAKRF